MQAGECRHRIVVECDVARIPDGEHADDAFERDMERMRRITGEEVETAKRTLELNRSHPIVASLAHKIESGADSELVNATIEQLFDNALLLEGLHKNPADMVERIQKLMAAAVGGK